MTKTRENNMNNQMGNSFTKDSENMELKNWNQLMIEEDGMGTVEIILIIVVLVGLVLIFKDQITAIVESIFAKITKQTNRF